MRKPMNPAGLVDVVRWKMLAQTFGTLFRPGSADGAFWQPMLVGAFVLGVAMAFVLAPAPDPRSFDGDQDELVNERTSGQGPGTGRPDPRMETIGSDATGPGDGGQGPGEGTTGGGPGEGGGAGGMGGPEGGGGDGGGGGDPGLLPGGTGGTDSNEFPSPLDEIVEAVLNATEQE